MYPAPGTPAYCDDAARLTPRPVVTQPKHLRAQARRRAMGERISMRNRRTIEAQQRELQAADQLEHSKYRSQQTYQDRIEEWQRVIESRHAEYGVETVKTEPSSFAGTDGAPPHLTSHWSTIHGLHSDPPPREHVKMITSYRRYFPEQNFRSVVDPSRPVWGGCR